MVKFSDIVWLEAAEEHFDDSAYLCILKVRFSEP